MPTWSIIGAAVFRVIVAFAPLFGLLNKDPDSFNLRGEILEEAKEVMDVVNSKIILLSWPPLTLIAILARSEQLCQGIGALPALIFIASTILLCTIFAKISPNILRGRLPPLVILLITTVLDTVFQIYLLDSTVKLICR